jgi:hypothetical protein
MPNRHCVEGKQIRRDLLPIVIDLEECSRYCKPMLVKFERGVCTIWFVSEKVWFKLEDRFLFDIVMWRGESLAVSSTFGDIERKMIDCNRTRKEVSGNRQLMRTENEWRCVNGMCFWEWGFLAGVWTDTYTYFGSTTEGSLDCVVELKVLLFRCQESINSKKLLRIRGHVPIYMWGTPLNADVHEV